ncbi:MAG TPA: hypothetical protein VHA52_06450 [Candidatus Babeliaceae bacterium]|nr:hypothetical protein [Candidatus Babeliaceae bacterium]
MRLTVDDAQQCIRLLSELDLFYTQIGKPVNIDDSMNASQVRAVIRSAWSRMRNFCNKYIGFNREKLSEEDIQVIKQWNTSIESRFVALKHYEEYTILYSIKDEAYYGVITLQDKFTDIVTQTLPAVIETRLFPYKDCVIWDGFVAIYDEDILDGASQFIQKLLEECEFARDHELVITQLNDLNANQEKKIFLNCKRI